MAGRIVVFYEDQLSGARPEGFGPHLLVRACVADSLAIAPWGIEATLVAHVCKGRDNVLPKVQERLPLGIEAFVVLDTDRPPAALGLGRDADPAVLREAIEAYFDHDPRVHGCPLRHNVETIVEAAAGALAQPVPPKKPLLRDLVLGKLASPSHRRERELVLASNDTLRELVDRITAVVRA